MKIHLMTRCILLASWYTFNFIILLHCYVFAFPIFDSSQNVSYPSISEVYILLRKRYSLSLPGELWIFLLTALPLLTIILWIVSTAFKKILKMLSLTEIYKITPDAVWWGVRNFFSSGLFLFGPIIFSISWATEKLDSSLPNIVSFVFLLVISIIFYIYIIIGILNKIQLESYRINKWYQIDWPGWQPLLISVGGIAALQLLGIITNALPTQSVLFNSIFVIANTIIYFYIFGIALSILIYRIHWCGIVNECRKRINLKFCAVWSLLSIRVFVILVWIAAPFMVAVRSIFLVVPHVRETFKITGTEAGIFFNSFLYFVDALFAYGYIAFLFIFIILIPLIHGKLLVLYDNLPSSKNR